VIIIIIIINLVVVVVIVVVAVKKKELMSLDFPYIQFKEQPEKTSMIVCARVLVVFVFS
jgi:uncharacterized protein YxeA